MPVKRILTHLVRGIIINVITAGDLIQPHDADTIPRYDGSISSTVTIAWFVAIVFVTMFVAVTLQFQNIKDLISNSIFALRVLGVIAIIAFSISMCKNRQSNATLSLSTSVKVKVKFLWFFGMLYTTMILDKIILYVSCIVNDEFSNEIKTQLFFRVADLLWIFLVTVFMTHFVCNKCRYSLLLHWGITTIMIAVMMSWCYSFLDHSFVKLFPRKHNLTVFRNQTLNPDVYSSDQDYYCNESLRLNRFFEAIKSPISSAAAEFYLMVFILLLEVISKSKAEYKSRTVAPFRIQMSDDITNMENENIASQEEPSETTPLVTSHVKTTRRQNVITNMTVAKTISLLIAGVAFIPQVIGTLLPYFTRPSGKAYLIWYGYQLLYSLLMLLCCFTVFCKLNRSCRPDQNRKRRKGYVLIVCSAFDTGLRTFNLIAAIFLLSKIPKIAVISILIPLNKIIINFLQTIFILHAHKFRKLTSSGILPLESVCLVLMIMNFGLWFVDNFGKYDYNKYDVGGFYIAKQFYGINYWHAVAIIILPVSMFYHLHSGIDLYEIYLDFKRM